MADEPQLMHTGRVQALLTLGLLVAIAVALLPACKWIGHRFRRQLDAHRRAVRFVVISVVPVLLLGGATLGATGSLHKAWSAGLGAFVAGWLAEFSLRYLSRRRRIRSFPSGVVPGVAGASRRFVRHS